MRKYLTILQLMLAALITLMGCAADDMGNFETGSPIDPVYRFIPTKIRFETSDGENMLAQYGDISQKPAYYPFKPEEVPWLTVSCRRGSDGALMTFSERAWYTPMSQEETDCYGEGPILSLSWIDFDGFSDQNHSFPFRESYTLHVSSTRFWDGEEHTIRWEIEVQSRERYCVLSCAIDGVEAATYLDEAMEKGEFIGRVRLVGACEWIP